MIWTEAPEHIQARMRQWKVKLYTVKNGREIWHRKTKRWDVQIEFFFARKPERKSMPFTGYGLFDSTGTLMWKETFPFAFVITNRGGSVDLNMSEFQIHLDNFAVEPTPRHNWIKDGF